MILLWFISTPALTVSIVRDEQANFPTHPQVMRTADRKSYFCCFNSRRSRPLSSQAGSHDAGSCQLLLAGQVAVEHCDCNTFPIRLITQVVDR